jgi:hypothetical protein
MEQCRQDLHGNLDPLPRNFTPVSPTKAGLKQEEPYGAVQTGPARYPGPLPMHFTSPSLTQVGLGQGDHLEQCRQDLHSTLDPLPRQFTTLPIPGWFGAGGHNEAVQTGPARYPPGWSGAESHYGAVQSSPVQMELCRQDRPVAVQAGPAWYP